MEMKEHLQKLGRMGVTRLYGQLNYVQQITAIQTVASSGPHRVPFIQRRAAFNRPAPELVELWLQVIVQECKGGLHLLTVTIPSTGQIAVHCR